MEFGAGSSGFEVLLKAWCMCRQHTEQHKDIRKPSLVQLLYGRRTVRSHNDVYYHGEQSCNAVLLEVQTETSLRSSSGSFRQELEHSHHREGGPLATHAGSLTEPETARPKCSKRLPLAPPDAKAGWPESQH